jgi:hypothetical protein
MTATTPHDATYQEDTMTRLESITVMMGLCALLATSSARAESSPFVGRWQWNQAQSTPPPGAPGPEGFLCDIARTESSHLQWSITILTTEDQPYVETFDVTTDGEFSPISSETTASVRLTDDILQATFKGPAGASDVQTCTLSADQKQMTCRGVLRTGAGQAVKYVDVYDRRENGDGDTGAGERSAH